MSWKFLPMLADDETVYGWAAFCHAANQVASGEQTAAALFGARHAMRQYELPSGLMALPGLWNNHISAEALLRTHTVGGFYVPFLSSEVQTKLLRGSPDGSRFWVRTVRSTSRSLPVGHPLRVCDQCIKNDIELHGRSIWHVQHQDPGVAVCTVHQRPLTIIQAPKKRWIQPLDALYGGSALCSVDISAMTYAAVAASNRDIERANVPNLRYATLERLVDIGVIHSRRKTSHDRIISWFRRTGVAKLCVTPELGLASLQHGDWVPGLLWRRKTSHAVRWSLLWAALDWSSPSEAAAEYREVCQKPIVREEREPLPTPCERRAPAPAPHRVKVALSHTNSYREAAGVLNCSVKDLVRWLERDLPLRIAWRQRRAEFRAVAKRQKSQRVSAPATN